MTKDKLDLEEIANDLHGIAYVVGALEHRLFLSDPTDNDLKAFYMLEKRIRTCANDIELIIARPDN